MLTPRTCVDDLVDPFKADAEAFIKALEDAGAKVSVRTTRRSDKRAYLVIIAEPQKVEQARIEQQTDSPATCQPLIEGRAAVNAKPGVAFYALEAPSISSTDMGFGIVAPPAKPEVVDGLARVDLDQDGRGEVFSSCATTEGINFAVWTEKAYEGEPRWSGYYYLNYETTPTCP